MLHCWTFPNDGVATLSILQLLGSRLDWGGLLAPPELTDRFGQHLRSRPLSGKVARSGEIRILVWHVKASVASLLTCHVRSFTLSLQIGQPTF